MFLSYKHLADGPGPSEVIVEVNTLDGPEEVIVDKSILRNGFFDVGGMLGRRPGQTLVELPRESVRGLMRVWVSNEEVRKSEAA